MSIYTHILLVSKLKIKKRYKLLNQEQLYTGNLDDNDSKWNQFELNKNKFNVKTTYDETKYTTELDKELIPMKVKQKADKIAKVNFLI